MSLIEKVEEALVTSELILPDEGILVGVSGGVDSMVLLDVLHRLAGSNGWRLSVAHFNHLLRGKESDEDEAFVKAVTESLGIPFVVGRADVAQLGADQQVSVEMAAREARHAFFVREARARDVRKVLLAHHADDQAELFFLRLFRGAGSDGLGGMKQCCVSPYSDSIELIRPLLDCSKAMLLSFAKGEGVRFREDYSNRDSDILRNRVRNQLLPLLREQYSESVVETVARSMTILSGEHDFIEFEAQRWLSPEANAESGRPFEALHVALQREILRHGLLAIRVLPEFWMIEGLRKGGGDSVITVAGGRRVRRRSNGCLIELAGEEQSFKTEIRKIHLSDLTDRKQRLSFGGIRLSLELVERGIPRNALVRADLEECFDADAIGSFIQMRHWRPGDRFQPIGMAKSVKLQDWFTNQKIPAFEKRLLVLAEAKNGDLFWVEGMRIGECFKVNQTTKRILKIAWEREVKI